MSQASGSEPLRPLTGASDSNGDPGRGDPIESDHRLSSADPGTMGPQPQQHEPTPGVPDLAEDDFAWLYRQDASASGVTADGDPRTLMLPLDSQPSYVPSQQPVPAPPPSLPRGRNPMIIMIGMLLFLTAGAVRD